MNDTDFILQKIVKGIQEKKGKNITIVDLTKIEDAICDYFVICEGNSGAQISAIVDSIKNTTQQEANSKPFAIDGLNNAEWVAIDYANILVHVFLPEIREFYNLENLWADASFSKIDNVE